MKKIFYNLVFSFLVAFQSYGFPYSSNNEIQIYSKEAESFLSSKAKKCIEDSDKKGVMDQLNQKLGCSNFSSAEKVCNCIDKRFDKEKLNEFYDGYMMTELENQMQMALSLDESTVEPKQLMVTKLTDLNLMYDEMGIGGCSFGNNDAYFRIIGADYNRDKNKKAPGESNNTLNRQHQVFNRMLKELKSAKPTNDELMAISKKVSEQTGEKFFLESRLENTTEARSDDAKALYDIKEEIINEYVSFHLHEIKSGVDPDEFFINKVSSNLTKEKGRSGCRKLLSYAAVKKESTLNDKITSNFVTFFPESYLSKSSDESDRKDRLSKVSSSISSMNSTFAMIGPAEHEKDIFYCRKYNLFRERSAAISSNKPLRLALAKLETLKSVDLLAALSSSSSSSDDGGVQSVLNQIEELELAIMNGFDMNKDALSYALMGFKIWKVDKGVQTTVNDNGTIAFSQIDSSSRGRQSISEMMNAKSRNIERARNRSSSRKSSSIPSFVVARSTSINTIESKNSSRSIIQEKGNNATTSKSIAPSSRKSGDNYFNQVSRASSFKPTAKSSQRANEFRNKRQESQRDREESYDDYITKRINNLKQDKINTEKALSDELASTKESLELAKLREELRKQSEEIAKLSKKKEEVAVAEATPSSRNAPSSPVSFKSPLASALDKSFIGNSSDEPGTRAGEGTNGRSAASGYSASADQPSSGSSSSGSSGGTIANTGFSGDESSSISGISLSSLRNIGDDVQVIDNSNLGEIRPIIVDASFSDLSEEEKREKIEELLESNPEEEVYIEFPDGKVLKFSKKDELKKKAKAKESVAKKEEDQKKRNIFSYETLKDIIDSNK
ncbi:hypothetical protein [Halobacteriovorax sp. JY17]|uniref:hypothetical protein n=1 Tax=Halobacteriovorax sp. JY17 TaxID=2014617 RepID=UPI000C3868E3|nr:hypothetical protein [Halobacteriovorax sp. JY17]PIK15273.1 MAG: hypothetical protein CES88_00760 [Halobacteriovorax sp. JY17]